MTDMTDAQISKALALAIGYSTAHVKENIAGGISVARHESPQGYAVPGWYGFDYRDPAVIWPIAERFDCFPRYYVSTETWACSPAQWARGEDTTTAAKVVALAVIRAHGG